MKDVQATSKSNETEQTSNTYCQPSTSRVSVESDVLSVTAIGNVSSQGSAITKVLVKCNLLGSFLESPSAPSRKGKRNIERFPFAITSESYQEMYRKEQELKEEQEKEKENRKRKRAEKQNNKKGKGDCENITRCSICSRIIKSGELQCAECKRYSHRKCVPEHHATNIPSDDDDISLPHLLQT
nr:unnamed protein product [Callosobruchus analis]